MAATYTGNRRKSAGYNALMMEIRIGDFSDPWGTAMGWCFALASVLYLECNRRVPDFNPGPLRSRADIEDEYPDSMVLDLYDADTIDRDDMLAVFAVLTRYTAWVRLAGRDY